MSRKLIIALFVFCLSLGAFIGLNRSVLAKESTQSWSNNRCYHIHDTQKDCYFKINSWGKDPPYEIYAGWYEFTAYGFGNLGNDEGDYRTEICIMNGASPVACGSSISGHTWGPGKKAEHSDTVISSPTGDWSGWSRYLQVKVMIRNLDTNTNLTAVGWRPDPGDEDPTPPVYPSPPVYNTPSGGYSYPTPSGGGGGGGSAASCGAMQLHSTARCSDNFQEDSPDYRASAGACADLCASRNSNTCNWYSHTGSCYSGRGSNCYVSGGAGGWYGAVCTPGTYGYQYPAPYGTPYAYEYQYPYPYPTPAFDYTLSNAGSVNVTKSSENTPVQTTVTKTLTSGSTQSVSVDTSGLPSGVSIAYSGRTCSPNCNTTITLVVGPSVPAGTYPITVTGDPLGRQTSFNLVVIDAPISISISCSVSPIFAQLNHEPVTWTAIVEGGTPPFSYVWQGFGIPTNPAPTTNPYTLTYSTLGLKTARATVTDSSDPPLVTTCASGPSVRIWFQPKFEEF